MNYFIFIQNYSSLHLPNTFSLFPDFHQSFSPLCGQLVMVGLIVSSPFYRDYSANYFLITCFPIFYITYYNFSSFSLSSFSLAFLVLVCFLLTLMIYSCFSMFFFFSGLRSYLDSVLSSFSMCSSNFC